MKKKLIGEKIDKSSISSTSFEHGFTLVLMSALLIVASLVSATVLLSQSRKEFWQPKLDTKVALAEINDAIIKFQRINHRLPCPAPIDQLPESAGYGVEGANCDIGTTISGITRTRLDGSACSANVADTACIRIGVVPIRTLGLSNKYAADKWANRLNYVAYEKFIDPYSFSSTTGNLRINDASGNALLSDAAYVLYSGGADGKGMIGARSTQVGKACDSSVGKDQENCNNDGVFTSSELNTVEGVNYYDDQINYAQVDTVAQSINKPCAPPSPSSPFPWGVGCSATYVNMVHGASATLNNTATNFAGMADVTCNNGNFTINSQSCVAQSPCPSNTANWVGTGLGCSANYGLLNSGQNATINNSALGRTGSVNVACNNGVITQSGASCSPNNCSLPWGGSLAHSGSITAYQAGSVTCGNSCTAETRSCSYGTLSGSYTNQNCMAAACSNCNLPWGGTLAHNSTVTAFAASSVACGSSCAAETRSCNNGVLSGSYTEQSCSVATCSACNLPWGGTIAQGGSVTAYQGSGGAGCGSGVCNTEVRSCNNGNLSGSYSSPSCTTSSDTFTLSGYFSGRQWLGANTPVLDICNTHPYIQPNQSFTITTDTTGSFWGAVNPIETWYFKRGYPSFQQGGGGYRRSTYTRITYDGNCAVSADARYLGDEPTDVRWVQINIVSGTCGRPSPCRSYDGGTLIAHGASGTYYPEPFSYNLYSKATAQQEGLPFGQYCEDKAEIRTCNDYVLSGSSLYEYCEDRIDPGN